MTKMQGEIVKEDRLGRRRTRPEQREAMLAEYEGSGMSGPEYAEYIRVKYPTFAAWLQRRKREGKVEAASEAKPALQWVEAEVEREGEKAPGSTGLVIRLRGGEEMLIRDGAGVKLAVEVLRQLGGAKGC